MEIFRDRDYLQDENGDIYQVLGSVHFPQGILALQKYKRVMDSESEINRVKFALQGLDNPLQNVKTHQFRLWVQKNTQDKFARILPNYTSIAADQNMRNNPYCQFSPVFNRELLLIPRNAITTHWKPEIRLRSLLHTIEKGSFEERQNLDTLERETVEVALTLNSLFNIPLKDMGVSGSILWDSHHDQSDIDMMIYGQQNRKRLFESSNLPSDQGTGLRKIRKIEIYPLAKKMSVKSGLSFEDCFVHIYHKPYLFFFRERKISITFAPLPLELVRCPLYLPETRFEELGPCHFRGHILADDWGYDYPGLFAISVDEVIKSPSSHPQAAKNVTRLLVYEHEFVTYFHPGDEIEVKGLLQVAHKVPDYGSPQVNLDTYQILVGAVETFGNEFIQIISPEK
ncbi:MAG: hypothetical protein ACTSRK_13000 [Promethearchaeota archaeon]